MPNGNVRDYVGKNPEISRLKVLTQTYARLELTRLQLLDTSRGLSFLRSEDIVHEGLKGVRLCFFLRLAAVGSISPSPTSG